MSAIVEEKEDANESLKKQKLDEEAAKKIVEEQGEVKESTRGEKPEKKSLKQKVGEQWQLIIKCFELLLCAACVGVCFEPYSEIERIELHHIAVMYTASTGYILIGVNMVVSRLMGDKIAYKTNAIFSIIAAVLFFVTGVFAAKDQRRYTNKLSHPEFYLLQMLVATAAFSFINSAVFVVDAVLALWKKVDF